MNFVYGYSNQQFSSNQYIVFDANTANTRLKYKYKYATFKILRYKYKYKHQFLCICKYKYKYVFDHIPGSKSSAPPPPPATSVSSPCADIESRVDSLSVTVATLAEFIHSKLDAITASVCQPSLPQVSSQARLEPDVRDPHPGSTAGYHQESQALGGPDRSPAGPSLASQYIHQGVRAQFVEQLGSASAAQPTAALGTAPQPSAASAHRPPPTGFTVPPHTSQPSTSGWVPSGPPPSRSAPESRSA